MKIPGIGAKTGLKLINMGIERVRTLGDMKPEQVECVFGKNGIELWKRANGIDDSPVVPWREQKSISTEHTFQQDTIDIRFLQSELVRMTEQIAFQLRSENKLAGCIAPKLRYSDFETHDMQRSIPCTNADYILMKVAQELFTKLYQRRQLVRLLGIRFSNLVIGTYQINVFDDKQERINLYKAIDSVKKQFGERVLLRAAGLR